MHRIHPRLLIALTIATTIAACSRSNEPNASELAAAMNTYLAERGQLCLGKAAWPIDLTQHEIDVGARNALQMPVLERLGLVTSSVADITVDDEGTLHPMQVRRYVLTDAGRTYYLPRSTAHASNATAPTRDFCAAHLSLDRIVGWDLHRDGSAPVAVVRYTYRVEAAPWTHDAEIQKVFPMVAGVVMGEGKAELQESFTLTSAGWVAVDLQGA